jgi:GYF domain 2
MKYYIQRQLNEYGPYTLADLQRYVAQGSIQLTDLTRSEGMADWVPVSQVLGNIPVPVPPPAMQPPAPAAYGSMPAAGGGSTVYGGPVYGGPGTVYNAAAPMPVMSRGPIPTDLHWALVFLITMFCGIFQMVWIFIEASFVKQIDRESKGIVLLIAGIAAQVVAFIVLFASAAQWKGAEPDFSAFAPFLLFILIGAVLHWVAVFNMRSSLENYYNTVEPINLRLSGVMTFFFAVYYFQYHFSRIAQWKKTGYIQPQ